MPVEFSRNCAQERLLIDTRGKSKRNARSSERPLGPAKKVSTMTRAPISDELEFYFLFRVVGFWSAAANETTAAAARVRPLPKVAAAKQMHNIDDDRPERRALVIRWSARLAIADCRRGKLAQADRLYVQLPVYCAMCKLISEAIAIGNSAITQSSKLQPHE